jgi:hypothetical protein
MKQILGRVDYFDFSELNLKDVPVKIDTGAYLNSIHCTAKKLEGDILYFTIGEHKQFKFPNKEYRTTNYTVNEITSSNGEGEQRFTIKTPIIIFGKTIEAEFTLADRTAMAMPVLIGRTALSDFLIDINLKNTSFKDKYNKLI